MLLYALKCIMRTAIVFIRSKIYLMKNSNKRPSSVRVHGSNVTMANRKITDLFSAVNNSSSSVFTKSATGSSAETPTVPEVAENVSKNLNEDSLCRPAKTFTFPKTKIGERNRSCQHKWFEQFPWLIYDTK